MHDFCVNEIPDIHIQTHPAVLELRSCAQTMSLSTTSASPVCRLEAAEVSHIIKVKYNSKVHCKNKYQV